jgi:hypothetical protein
MTDTTTSIFWDCNCREDYIHPDTHNTCPACGAKREECPDSRVSEVLDYFHSLFESGFMNGLKPPKKKLLRFYLYENNSGGVTVLKGGPYFFFDMESCDSIDDAVRHFESLTGLDWDFQNSYEGNSCSCCGRRFDLDVPEKLKGTTYSYQYGYVGTYSPKTGSWKAKNSVELKKGATE